VKAARSVAFWIALCFCCFPVGAKEVIPPKPEQYVHDEAGVLSSGVRDSLLHEIEDFERQTSDQIVVALYPHMESDSSVEDYTVRVAQSWHAGRTGKDNGVVMFVFVNDHKLYIQVGYGLEGPLTDALCRRIIENEIKPRFRMNDYDGGIQNGVHAIMAAIRGEYQGTGTTVDESQRQSGQGSVAPFLIFLVILVFMAALQWLSSRRTVYSSRGRIISPWWFGGFGMGNSGGFGSFGGSGGGSSFGGFSGGGGSFGGGGAGGSW